MARDNPITPEEAAHAVRVAMAKQGRTPPVASSQQGRTDIADALAREAVTVAAKLVMAEAEVARLREELRTERDVLAAMKESFAVQNARLREALEQSPCWNTSVTGRGEHHPACPRCRALNRETTDDH